MFIVTSLLLATISAASAGDLVEIWGIARCPDTSKFVHNQLVPFYKNNTPFPAEFKLDFHAVPTGGSMVDGKYINKCLHGKVECSLNKLQMCAKKYMTADWMITMGCIQGRRTYESGVECIQDDEQGNKIKACAESMEGEYLLNDENSYRYNTAPQSAWLPWVQINGQRVQPAEFNLAKYVCELESMKDTEQCKRL